MISWEIGQNGAVDTTTPAAVGGNRSFGTGAGPDGDSETARQWSSRHYAHEGNDP
jgi:hypothetical protein